MFHIASGNSTITACDNAVICSRYGCPTPTPTPTSTPEDCELERTPTVGDFEVPLSPEFPGPYCCSDIEAAICIGGGGIWDPSTCTCISPIVVDVLGNGFDLTSAQGGVWFDIVNDGVGRQVAWTSAGSDDAWLALDRNGNGRIDKGKELFGSSTPQPALQEGETKNGFRALAVFDRINRGGNGDGRISPQDAVYNSLKLWQDTNHNGISEPNELHGISELGLRVIDLQYEETRRVDANGNWFRFRSRVRDAQNAQLGRWAWDVFLQVEH